jgi:putative ABC transport system permease protein
MIVGAVMGSVLLRLLVAIPLRLGLNPNDLKLITAVFVLVAPVPPGIIKKLKPRKTGFSGA